MPTTPLALLGFGFVLGIRHALDADHLAAISTILSQRRGLWRSSLVGVVWGLGHTTALLLMAVAMIALHAQIPARVALTLELGVAAMLIGLGTNLLWSLWRGGQVHYHTHDHGGRLHVHPHVHVPGRRHEATGHHHVRRPFLIGLVHGLAGSAGLMLVVAASIPSPTLALAYVALFGLGSIGGMALMSVLLGAPLALIGERFTRADGAVRACAAVASVVVGVLLAWEITVQAAVL